MIKFTINVAPVTKKNSQQICINSYTKKPFIRQSENYKTYEKDCRYFVPHLREPIDYPVNVQCIYYMKTRRKVDLSNLLNATLDILVKYGVLEDDNRNIVYSVDGSRVYHDKERARTEVFITPIKEDIEIWEKRSK